MEGPAIRAKAHQNTWLPVEAECIDVDGEGNDALCVSQQSVEKNVRVVTKKACPVMPFRLSVELPRVIYVTMMAGVRYLLSIALHLLPHPKDYD